MTAKEAKDLSLEVWGYLKDNPNIRFKSDMPENIYKEIRLLKNLCPLCHYFNIGCKFCPLWRCRDCRDFSKWFLARTNKTRKKYAAAIYDKIKNWDISKLDFQIDKSNNED